MKLSKGDLRILLFVDDKVDDPVKLSHELDVDEEKINTVLNKLEKNELVKITRKQNKPFSVKITVSGKLYLKRNKKRLEYC